MDLEQRIKALEDWRTLIEVSLSEHRLNSEYMKKEFAELKDELKEIKQTAKNLNFTIWGAVILVFIKFALSGGLKDFI